MTNKMNTHITCICSWWILVWFKIKTNGIKGKGSDYQYDDKDYNFYVSSEEYLDDKSNEIEYYDESNETSSK